MEIPAIQKAKGLTERLAAIVGRDCDHYVVERKYDGHRGLLVKDNGVVRYYQGGTGGQGREKSALIPHIIEAAKHLPDGTILDGEACARDRDSWNIVQSVLGSGSTHPRHRETRFVAFDVLAIGGNDCRGLSGAERRGYLEQCVDLLDGDDVVVAEQFPACDADKHYKAITADGGEGVVIKDTRAPYLSGKRPVSWIKMKLTVTEDVVVMGATPGEGKYRGMIGALVFGQYVNGVLVEQGKCSGPTDDERAMFTELDEAGQLAGIVIEVSYNGKVGEARRHPQFKRIRTDKPAEDCVAA